MESGHTGLGDRSVSEAPRLCRFIGVRRERIVSVRRSNRADAEAVRHLIWMGQENEIKTIEKANKGASIGSPGFIRVDPMD